MSLPRFFSRVNDSIGPLLSSGADIRTFLADKCVKLEAPSDLENHPFHWAGFILLANLCARLYPNIRLVAPARVAAEAEQVARRINPDCGITIGQGSADATVGWCCGVTSGVSVAPSGWDVLIDLPESQQINHTNVLASLAAAAIGASSLFRMVFSTYLPKGRAADASEPSQFSLLPSHPSVGAPPDLPSDIPLGKVHLVGAGAVGQAMVYALARISATGRVTVIDPEVVTLSNLQRYVLTDDGDAGVSKCLLVERALAGTRLEVVPVEASWDADLEETRAAEVICSAVDSEEVRIALQASLPRRVYNGWTQPGDIGWSRHEDFGVQPCVACLYWPNGPKLSYHELVARALRQHELRVLSYLSFKVPIDLPLGPSQIANLPQYVMPPESVNWSQRSLLDDVAESLGVDPIDLIAWKGRHLPDLYRDGICGGALIRKQLTEVPQEMAVPLAHQSVLAGIMMTTQLVVAARPELLAHRQGAVDNRLDLLAPLPQVSERPRQLTEGCICSDPDFVARYRAKWPWGPTP